MNSDSQFHISPQLFILISTSCPPPKGNNNKKVLNWTLKCSFDYSALVYTSPLVIFIYYHSENQNTVTCTTFWMFLAFKSMIFRIQRVKICSSLPYEKYYIIYLSFCVTRKMWNYFFFRIYITEIFFFFFCPGLYWISMLCFTCNMPVLKGTTCNNYYKQNWAILLMQIWSEVSFCLQNECSTWYSAPILVVIPLTIYWSSDLISFFHCF